MEESRIFRIVAENAPDIVCLHHPKGEYIYVSPSCKNILGYNPEELIGKNPYDLVYPQDIARIQNESHPQVLSGLEATVTYRIRKSSGDYIWLETTNRPVVDSLGKVQQIISMSREITTRRKTEDELAREYAISSTAVGIAMADLEGKLFYVNPTFLNMWGIDDSKDVLEKKILDFSNNKEIAAEGLQAVKEHGKWEGNAVVRRKDGTSFHEHIIANVVTDADGHPYCIMASFIDTTERTRMDEVLRESEEKFRTLAELSPNMIFINRSGMILYANKRCEEIMGYSREELCSPNFDFMSLIAPEYRDAVKESFNTHLSGLEVSPIEYTLMTRNGTMIHTLLSTKLITFGGEKAILGTAMDITGRKKMERELLENEAKYRELVENANTIILRYDERGKITFFNEYAQNFFHYTQEEIIGKDVMVLVPPLESSGRKLETLCKDILENPDKFEEYENENVLQDGTLVWVSWRNKAIKDSNGNITILAIGQDITEHKQAQEALRKYNKELELANRELETFSYSISHDLKAPLRRMEGFSQMLLEDYPEIDDKGKDYLYRIRESSNLMSQLIDDILKLSYITRAELERIPVYLSDMAKSIVEELQYNFPDRQVKIKIAPQIHAIGDPRLLRALLENLFNNAWKFTGKTQEPLIEFGVTVSESEKVYFVRDNGAGFNMAQVDSLFQPFKRLHSSSQFPGTGIGLASVKRIVQRHDGKVWAEGEAGKGAIFYFTLH